jgi:hypothetical protein
MYCTVVYIIVVPWLITQGTTKENTGNNKANLVVLLGAVQQRAENGADYTGLIEICKFYSLTQIYHIKYN